MKDIPDLSLSSLTVKQVVLLSKTILLRCVNNTSYTVKQVVLLWEMTQDGHKSLIISQLRKVQTTV